MTRPSVIAAPGPMAAHCALVVSRMLSSIFTAVIIAILSAGAAHADDYPNKPVRLVVGAAAGGGFDVFARLLGDKLSAIWNQPVIVDNRPGAGHVLATEFVAHSEPDGYTLLVAGANHTLNPLLHDKLSYDTLKDFAPVILWAKTPFVLEVNAALPVHSVPELLALARSRDGSLNYTASQLNSSSHIAGELLKQIAQVKMTFVPYRGSAPALQDVLANRVSVMIDAPVSSLPHIRSGALRALAVTSLRREPSLPDVPTMAESGFPGFEVVAWIGLVAPAHTRQAVIDRLNATFTQVLKEPDVRATLAAQGWDITPGSPHDLDLFIQKEIDHYRDVVRAANLHAE
jgi:tripartite-type tricarboxylate transporter receptor subunit TctC